MDKVTPAVRSRIMSRIRGKDTKPELALRRSLHSIGVRYRVHSRQVVGTPDIAHAGARVAVFVDGCFWHGCPHHYRVPSSRVEFWTGKLSRNKARRHAVLRKLKSQDWLVLQYWECEVRAKPAKLAKAISRSVKSRRQRRFLPGPSASSFSTRRGKGSGPRKMGSRASRPAST
ncbi:MAG: very short patch repair endonuclease [Candidatus Thermoplasmatota archaeon]